MYLILDGVVPVESDRERVVEYGPGAMLGGCAHLEGRARTSPLEAVTDCRVASVPAQSLVYDSLQELATGYRREDSNVG